MLSEERQAIILNFLEKKGSITVTELTKLLDISESTARRDITLLDKAGKLTKVFGGAVALEHSFLTKESTVEQKKNVNRDEKRRIARYAVSLIRPEDFVYLDAGTTTGYMLEFLKETKATFVTNAVAHAQRLAANGIHVLLVGGTLKSSTEAVVGTTAAMMLEDYHFTIGFFGTNGISKTAGFTTPDVNEALVKKAAIGQCRNAYILGDHTKFQVISSVTFASLPGKTVLTDECPAEFQNMEGVVLCP